MADGASASLRSVCEVGVWFVDRWSLIVDHRKMKKIFWPRMNADDADQYKHASYLRSQHQPWRILTSAPLQKSVQSLGHLG